MSQLKNKLGTKNPVVAANTLVDGALEMVSHLEARPNLDPVAMTRHLVAAFRVLARADVREETELLVYEETAVNAMSHLSLVLALIQDADIVDPAVVSLARVIARSLALLYPLSRLTESPSRLPASPVEQKPPPGAERRQTPRAAVEACIGFQSETNFYTGFSEDISTGGLFIATYDVKPIGSKLNVNFTLPSGQLISTDGVVRWVREFNDAAPDITPGMGVQFENLHPSDKETIQSFIKQHSALFFDE